MKMRAALGLYLASIASGALVERQETSFSNTSVESTSGKLQYFFFLLCDDCQY